MRPVRTLPAWPQGEIRRIGHDSSVLRGNPWDDPTGRELCVYLPPDYQESGPPLLALWDLAAFGNAGPGHLNWRGHGESLPQRLDRLIHEGRLPPVAVAMPDCFTSLGGNQYLDSPAVGLYGQYLVDELVPLLESRVNVRQDRNGRGLFGKSSGGFGALWQALHYPDTWGGLAAHAPDCGFEWLYPPEFPGACLSLAEFGGDCREFLRAYWRKSKPSAADFQALLVVAMAATYDPDPEQPERIRLPFHLSDCTLMDARWERWLAHDPVRLVASNPEPLRSLRCLWLDAGIHDQYNIQFGLRRLHAQLEKLGVRHHYEEVPGGHDGLDWRLDHSLPALAAALLASAPAGSQEDRTV